MEVRESRLFFGLLVISLGVAIILNSLGLIHDVFGLFVGIFFASYGFAILSKKLSSNKSQSLPYLSLFFFGVSLICLEFELLQFNTINLLLMLFVSLGIAYLIYGAAINYSIRIIITGIIFIVIALLIFIPKVFDIEDVFWSALRQYLIPIILIALGIVIILPRRAK